MRRIYYVPGMISLLILPLLIVYFVDRSGKGKPLYALQVTMFYRELLLRSDEIHRKYEPAFPMQEYPPKRNFENINITGIPANDSIKLAYSQIRVREILQGNNDKQGIHFIFGDSAKYVSFLKTLDLLQTEGARSYLVESDDIWFVHIPPDPPGDTLEPGMCCTGCIAPPPPPPPPTMLERAVTKIKEGWNAAWQLFIGFPIFLFIALRRMFSTQ